MKTLPGDLVAYKKTPTFTELTVPTGLLKAHQTKAGTWGHIVVLRGTLLYRILEPIVAEVILSNAHFGVVEPTVLHEVEILGPVEFYVEFYKSEPADL